MTDKRGTERVPITAELRAAMRTTADADTGTRRLDCDSFAFDCLCDAIDTVHANLERENERLRAELDRLVGEREDCCEQRVVGNAFVTIQPRIDWMRMVDELDVFTQLVRGFAEQVEVDE